MVFDYDRKKYIQLSTTTDNDSSICTQIGSYGRFVETSTRSVYLAHTGFHPSNKSFSVEEVGPCVVDFYLILIFDAGS